MTREQYIQMRNTGSPEPLYTYYKENWKKERDKFMLNMQEFINFFRMWPEAQTVYDNIMAYYDHKFEVFKVQDLRTGDIIKYY